MSDSAQSSGLSARVGHLDISSALPASVVRLVGESFKLNSVCWLFVSYSSVNIPGSHHCAGMPAL